MLKNPVFALVAQAYAITIECILFLFEHHAGEFLTY